MHLSMPLLLLPLRVSPPLLVERQFGITSPELCNVIRKKSEHLNITHATSNAGQLDGMSSVPQAPMGPRADCLYLAASWLFA